MNDTIKTITHDLIQGSPEWVEFRFDHDGASEAAAMLNLSKKTSRTELMHMKHTGIGKEFSDFVQRNILDYGHEVEALARPIIEANFGIKLYPATFSRGRLSASVDGITMSGQIAFEHKQWNESLAESVCNGILPKEHQPQCQQIMLVNPEVEKVIFTVSDGTAEKMVFMEVLPDPAWADRIEKGWEQFHKDLAAYVPPEYIPKPVAATIRNLPALAVNVSGSLSVSGNLVQVVGEARSYLQQLKTTGFETDEDFVNCKENADFCGEREGDIEATQKHLMAQTAEFDEVMRTLDELKQDFAKMRILLTNAHKAENEARKLKIRKDVEAEYAEHLDSLAAEIHPIKLIVAAPDFAKAARNKRTLKSLENDLRAALAEGKILADATAKDMRAKLDWCKNNAAGQSALFPDLQQIITKPMEDFILLITSRIESQKRAEAEKLETETARIREEERVKAEAKASAEAAKLKTEQAESAKQNAELDAQKPKEVVQVKAVEPLVLKDNAKKYITLVFEYETDEDLQSARELSGKQNCRAWSLDHEMLRVDLMRQAIENDDLVNAARYCDFDGVIALRDELH